MHTYIDQAFRLRQNQAPVGIFWLSYHSMHRVSCRTVLGACFGYPLGRVLDNHDQNRPRTAPASTKTCLDDPRAAQGYLPAVAEIRDDRAQRDRLRFERAKWIWPAFEDSAPFFVGRLRQTKRKTKVHLGGALTGTTMCMNVAFRDTASKETQKRRPKWAQV